MKTHRQSKSKEHFGWSEEKVKLLKKLYPEMEAKEIARIVDRSVAAVHRKACNLGLKKCLSWSGEEESLLRVLFSNKKVSDIADIMGRSVSAINARAHKLRLSGWGLSDEIVSLEQTVLGSPNF